MTSVADLPLGRFNFYAGIDPGAHGAIGLMNAAGSYVKVWKMPLTEKGEVDLAGLKEIYRNLARFPKVAVGIEWPEAWPGAFNNVIRDAELFGRQKGYLEAFAFLMLPPGSHYCRVSPVLWKGRLGLDGKQVVGANQRAASLWDMFYPGHRDCIRGSRGGLLDGPMDALLIAHFLRTRTGEGMRSIVDKFGKDSVEVMAFVLGGGRRKKKFGRRLDAIR